MTGKTISIVSVVRRGPRLTEWPLPLSVKKSKINSGASKNCWGSLFPRPSYRRNSDLLLPMIRENPGLREGVDDREGIRAGIRAGGQAAVTPVVGIQAVNPAGETSVRRRKRGPDKKQSK